MTEFRKGYKSGSESVSGMLAITAEFDKLMTDLEGSKEYGSVDGAGPFSHLYGFRDGGVNLILGETSTGDASDVKSTMEVYVLGEGLESEERGVVDAVEGFMKRHGYRKRYDHLKKFEVIV